MLMITLALDTTENLNYGIIKSREVLFCNVFVCCCMELASGQSVIDGSTVLYTRHLVLVIPAYFMCMDV